MSYGINIIENDTTPTVVVGRNIDQVIVVATGAGSTITKLSPGSVISKSTNTFSSIPEAEIKYINALLGVGYAVLLVGYSSDNKESLVKDLCNKYVYDPRFVVSTITPQSGTSSGTYDSATLELYNFMAQISTARQDVVALMDQPTSATYEYSMSTLVNALKSSTLTDAASIIWSQVAGFIGSPKVVLPSGLTEEVPASISYLIGHARATTMLGYPYAPIAGVQASPYLAISGVTTEVPGVVADKVQNEDSISTNPIVSLGRYGYTIFGNSTAMASTDTPSVLSQLSARLVVNYVKKAIHDICTQLSFSTNPSWVWAQFDMRLSEVLDGVVANNGLYSYDINIIQTEEMAISGKLDANVELGIQRAVSKFDIGVVLSDEDLEITESTSSSEGGSN